MRMLMHKVKVTYCILIVFVIVLNFRLGQARKGECKCAAFDNENGSTEPIIAAPLPASMIKVSCDDDGARSCREQCNKLGMNVPVNLAGTILCQKLDKTIIIPQIYLFASICHTGEWMRTEFKFLQSICCDAGKSVRCSDG